MKQILVRITAILVIYSLTLSLSVGLVAADTNGQLQDGAKIKYVSDINGTIWVPDDLDVDAQSFDSPHQYELIFEENSNRDISIDTSRLDEGLMGINIIITASLTDGALKYSELRDQGYFDGNGMNIQLSDKDSDPFITDMVPDWRLQEGDVRKANGDVLGTVDKHIENDTEVDTATSLIVDFTDYNHSIAPYLFVEDMEVKGVGNAVIESNWADVSGTIIENVTILDSSEYTMEWDYYSYLDLGGTAGATYLASLNFTNIIFEEFYTYDIDAEFEDGRQNQRYTFEKTGSSSDGLSPSGLFDTISEAASDLADKVDDFNYKQPFTKSDTSQDSTGYTDFEDSYKHDAAGVLGIETDDIKDYDIWNTKDTISIPDSLTSKTFEYMADKFSNGDQDPLDVFSAGSDWVSSIGLGWGSDITGNETNPDFEHSYDFTSLFMSGILDNLGNPMSASSLWGSGFLDNVVTSGLQFPSGDGFSLLSLLNNGLWESNDDGMNWWLIAGLVAVIGIGALVLMNRKEM